MICGDPNPSSPPLTGDVWAWSSVAAVASKMFLSQLKQDLEYVKELFFFFCNTELEGASKTCPAPTTRQPLLHLPYGVQGSSKQHFKFSILDLFLLVDS